MLFSYLHCVSLSACRQWNGFPVFKVSPTRTSCIPSQTPYFQDVSHPLLVVIVGACGLASNIFGFLLFHGTVALFQLPRHIYHPCLRTWSLSFAWSFSWRQGERSCTCNAYRHQRCSRPGLIRHRPCSHRILLVDVRTPSRYPSCSFTSRAGYCHSIP
jgi:hypothetical protein